MNKTMNVPKTMKYGFAFSDSILSVLRMEADEPSLNVKSSVWVLISFLLSVLFTNLLPKKWGRLDAPTLKYGTATSNGRSLPHFFTRRSVTCVMHHLSLFIGIKRISMLRLLRSVAPDVEDTATPATSKTGGFGIFNASASNY